MTESHENRLKRMKMRSMRRGTKEMDIILSRYADAHLPQMSTEELDLFDRLLEEYDPDIYMWISRQKPAPAEYTALVQTLADYHQR